MTLQQRPREIALLMLAAGGQPPRKRARDQKADRAGFALQRQLLNGLVHLDPDADQLDMALAQLIEEIGPPIGPVRAIAGSIRAEILAASESSSFMEHLLSDALHVNGTEREGAS